MNKTAFLIAAFSFLISFSAVARSKPPLIDPPPKPRPEFQCPPGMIADDSGRCHRSSVRPK